MKISIIGTGYVGLTTGVALAYLGNNVICMDNDEEKINNLKRGIIPIYEPGLEELLNSVKNYVKFTSDMGYSVKESDVIFICVGTPSKEDGSIDMSYFREAVIEIAKFINRYKVIVNKSTVPVGTGDWVKKEIRKYYKGEISVVSNPEFLREGSALKDFLEPDRIVIGVEDERSKEIMLEIYSKIDAPKLVTDIRSAEMIKYAANAFLAMKISFINEIANICEKVGADVKEVAKGIGLDKRIGPYFLNAGIGYGGSCFPKDIDGLLMIANTHNYDFKLLKAVAEVNKYQQEKFVRRIIDILKRENGNTVAIWGLAFKPNTDDVRKSPALKIIKMLAEEGYKIKAFDPKAIENAKKEIQLLNKEYIKNIIFVNDPYEAVKEAYVLALVTEWSDFLKIDMKKVKDLMHKPYFFDGRNLFEPEEMKNIGFHYEGVGRKIK
uniref:UDP-glucose 6-dehydrogenase n=1 Tax=Dictyoglomus thermophilum TaxID=14 RepID=A0A7C3MKW5_DICTH